MIGRREILAGGMSRAAFAPPATLAFDVLRDGTRIGRHALSFQGSGGMLSVAIAVDIVVTLGPVTLYRYTARGVETWRGDVFQSLDNSTDRNGKTVRLRAARTADGVAVDVEGAARVKFPAEAIPLTHWNILCTRRPLFNPEDGTNFDYRCEPRGTETIALADGSGLRAAHFAFVGKKGLEDWYDDRSVWAGLKTAGSDGSRIEYRRVAG